jgi:hypothetical protein
VAAEEARAFTLERFENSEFGQSIHELPTFDINELVFGKRLGRGGFSNVDEIRGILLRNTRKPTRLDRIAKSSPLKFNHHDSVAIDDRESRQFIVDHCFRRSGDARYAIKRARRDILNDEGRLSLGLCDLAIETGFLSSLEHPILSSCERSRKLIPIRAAIF